jgi:hypothetical protein
MIYTLLTDPVKVLDSVRTMNETHPSPGGLRFHSNNIESMLCEMHVFDELKKSVLHNVNHRDPTSTVRDLIRTTTILTTLQGHGLSGDCADEFLKGGHFKLKDDSVLFNKLTSLEGAEPRFSSHFKESKTEKFGITSGRILP